MTRCLALLAFAALAGCAGAAGISSASLMSNAETAAQSIASTDRVVPEACGVGHLINLDDRGGTFRTPECAGWSGTVGYASYFVGTRKARLRITSSVKNSFGVPKPPSGTALFYMQGFNVHYEVVDFIGYPSVTETISSPELTSSHTYTLIVYNLCYSPPCPLVVIDLGSPQGSNHSITFPSPLETAGFPTKKSGVGVVWQFIQN
jgi:hypothetical protein